jgi:hypothetical protein
MPAVRPLFVLFGDSITQRGFAPGGWAAALADRYGRRVDVVNRGYSGYNTALATHLLPHVFPQARLRDCGVCARGETAKSARGCGGMRCTRRSAAA